MKSALVFGHVNVGKSTLLGHLLYKLDYITEHEFKQLLTNAEACGKERSVFARIMDCTVEEQESGNTYEYNMVKLKYSNQEYIFYDTPGHHIFLAQFIDALTNAPATVILIVSAEVKELESSISSGFIREYTIICRCLGITKLVVAINKMDKIKWGDYEIIKNRVQQIVGKIGYNATYIVCNGFTGEGLTERTSYYPEVPCLLETLIDEPYKETSDCIMSNKCLIHAIIFDKIPLSAGWSGVAHLGKQTEVCKIIKVFNSEKCSVPFVKNSNAYVLLEFAKPLNYHRNSRLILRNGESTIAGGVVMTKDKSVS